MRNFSPQIFHSDYFSGWDVDELQTVLDNCERVDIKNIFCDNGNIFAGENYSDAAMPDAFCSDWLTFKGKGKEEGVQVHSNDILDR